MFKGEQGKKCGFTMIELMVSIAILGIVVMVGIPKLSDFTSELHVNNEISEINRFLILARNSAINNGNNVTICPINASNQCINDWKREIYIYNDLNNNQIYEPALGDTLIKIREKVTTNDQIKSSHTFMSYSPSGRMNQGNGGFISYCPYQHSELNRGIIITLSGKSYSTSDNDQDGVDEDRNGSKITCI